MVMKIAISTVLGFLSGLGIGGGSLLILWLTLGQQTDQTMARNINLMFFFPTAIIAACIRRKQGSLPLKRIWPAIVSGAASAAIGSFCSQWIEVAFLKQGFGILLLATGIRELFYKPKK